jgi:hypothetical protein
MVRLIVPADVRPVTGQSVFKTSTGGADDGEATVAPIAAITTIPVLTYLDDWKPHAGLVPRCLDQAVATLKQFAASAKQCIESLEARHVQACIDDQINPNAAVGASAKTVKRKLSELRNC